VYIKEHRQEHTANKMKNEEDQKAGSSPAIRTNFGSLFGSSLWNLPPFRGVVFVIFPPRGVLTAEHAEHAEGECFRAVPPPTLTRNLNLNLNPNRPPRFVVGFGGGTFNHERHEFSRKGRGL